MSSIGAYESGSKAENDPNNSHWHLESNETDNRHSGPKNTIEHASVVAAHYNHLEEKGIGERFKSPIFYLRNFNNWVKSVLIQEYVDRVREKDYGKRIRVLDICCGKGGDLSKWLKSRVNHVIFADIADVSIQQCKLRYNEIRNCIFTAQFIAADCTKESIRDKYTDPSIRFDIVSCQFGLHYSFESLSQVRQMFKNVTECLSPGGYFFGTIPNAYEIVSRAKNSPSGQFGNRIYNIKLLFDHKNGYPLFGAKYDFYLEGVVNCPEFLVNFDLFKKIASEYDLELVYKAGFGDFFNDHKNKEQYKNLLRKIMCFESYPAPPGKQLIGEESEYEHAKAFYESLENKNQRIGTMSKCEWEVATIYMAFVFQKCKK